MINNSTKAYIEHNKEEDVKKLALKRVNNQEVDVRVGLEQIAAYQIAKRKIETWAECIDIVYPVHLSMEQCSSEETARYKARAIEQSIENERRSIVDLTGGLGVDMYFVSRGFESATYVEMNEELCKIAKHNFRALGTDSIKVVNCKAEDWLAENKDRYTAVYLDPHRRSEHGGKVVSISDCTPNVCELREKIFDTTEHLWVKLSPMLDITLAVKEIGNVRDVYVVSLNNECKEVMIHAVNNYNGATRIHTANIRKEQTEEFSCDWEEEKDITVGEMGGYADLSVGDLSVGDSEMYVYEPNASIMKAGLFKTVSKEWKVRKLHQHSHLYSSKTIVEDFPGRKWKVERIIEFNKKAAKEIATITKKANVLTRNFPLQANELRDKLKLKDGGEVYVIGTTIENDKRIIIIAQRK